jgi:hypothetical protein
MRLIKQIHDTHTAGGGRIPLIDVVRLFPAQLTPEDEQKLMSRRYIVFTPNSPGGGAFSNQGPELKFKQGPAEATVPTLLQGTYTSAQNNFVLAFDPNHTATSKLVIFNGPKLEKVSANEVRADVGLSGDGYDQCIIHNP